MSTFTGFTVPKRSNTKNGKLTTYRGFKVHEVPDIDHEGHTLFKVYTPEEWSRGYGFRCLEWAACDLEEAHHYIDCRLVGNDWNDN